MSDYADEFRRMREGTFGSSFAYEREGCDVRHIRELFGDIGIDALRPGDISRAYATARERGRFKEGEIRRIHTKLKQVMQDAVDNELIQRNLRSSIKLPKANVEARQSLSAEEVSRLLSCLDEVGLSPGTVCAMLLLQCGLRKGALGPSWEDYDPKERRLRVNKQFANDKKLRLPKSKASRRVVSVGNSMAEWLERWRELQRKELAKYSIQQDGDTPIVHGVNVSKDGCGLRAAVVRGDGHNYSRWFRDFCVDNGFGDYEEVTKMFVRNGKERKRGKHYHGIAPHALRHTQATLLIGEGADAKTVQVRRGHASPSTTLAIYAHGIDNGLRVGLRHARVPYLAESLERLADYLLASSDEGDFEIRFAAREAHAIASRLVAQDCGVNALEVFVVAKDFVSNPRCRPYVFRAFASLMAASVGWPDQPLADELWRSAACRKKLCRAVDEAFPARMDSGLRLEYAHHSTARPLSGPCRPSSWPPAPAARPSTWSRRRSVARAAAGFPARPSSPCSGVPTSPRPPRP